MTARHLIVLIGLRASLAHAAVEHDVQSWTLFTAWGRQDKARWYLEVQPRVNLTTTTFDRLLVRVAFGFQLSEAVSVWAGYAWTPTFGPYRDEQRAFQQVLAEQKLGPVMLVNRFRLEERFIEGTSGPAYRVRHMVRAVARFGPSFGLAFSEEPFLAFNSVDKGPTGGFEQNRAFAGVNVKAGAWQFELGYMNVFTNRPPAVADRMAHVLTGMVVFTAP